MAVNLFVKPPAEGVVIIVGEGVALGVLNSFQTAFRVVDVTGYRLGILFFNGVSGSIILELCRFL